MPGAVSISAAPSVERFCAAHNIQNIVRNTLLTNLVICQLQRADEFLGIVGRIAHGDHARRMFTGLRFEHSLIYL